MSKQRKSGYEHAKRQHQSGFPIAFIHLGLQSMPVSQFKIGAMEYVSEKLAEPTGRAE